MADQLDPSMIERYLANSNNVFNINFKTGSDDVFPQPLNPPFTYPIFGQDEAIIGYSNPQINLTFRTSDMRPSLDFSYDDKFKAIGTTEAMDVVGMLQPFLPPPESDGVKSNDSGTSTDSANNDSGHSRGPPGERVTTYARGDKHYEIWCASLADPQARRLLTNMRILVPLFIEGGTACHYLDDPDWSLERWKLWLLYERRDDAHVLAGFSTSYRIWVFPDRDVRLGLGEKDIPEITVPPVSDAEAEARDPFAGPVPWIEEPPMQQHSPPPSFPDPAPADSDKLYQHDISILDEPSRERISQFIILPPFQHHGHGAALYDAMVSMFRADPAVFEITIEDPNEAMDELRDYQDLAHLRTIPEFASLQIADTVSAGSLDGDEYAPVEQLVDGAVLAALRRSSKIMTRQFDRLVEMQLLSRIPPLHRSAARLARRERSANPLDRRFFFWRLLTKHRIYIKNADQLSQLDEAERGPKVGAAVDAQMEEYVERLEVMDARRRHKPDGIGANGAAGSLKKGKGKRVVVEDEEEGDVAVKRAKT